MRGGTDGRSLAERRLRSAIALGDMAPGHRLVEADLVALLGVSRSRVRLAIDALVAEGLAERVPNRGARIRVVSVEEAVAITECRMALEGLIARKAAEHATDAGIDELRAHLARMRSAVDGGDVLAYSGLIHELHGKVREAARQPVAAELIGRLQGQLVRHQFRLSLRPGRSRVSLGELVALVDAVADRDGDRAEAAAAAHFRSVITALRQPTGEPAEV
jgi:DNA-binding GntR family transcriptional regulator